MGLGRMALKLLIDDFNKRGTRPHGKLLTLSRQKVGVDEVIFTHICKACGWSIDISKFYEKCPLINDEIIFSALGFEHLDSMDYSKYEGATIIHDLNDTNIPKELEGKYDFILDTGTIEHIFHFRNVLENIFKMLKVGGIFFFIQPTFFGINHGYYNFSPCVYHDYFTVNSYEMNAFGAFAIKGDSIYTTEPLVNDICASRPVSEWIENSLNLVWGSVTKTEKTTFDAVPYQGMYEKMWESSPHDTLYNALDEGVGSKKPIYLYGTGIYVRNLLQMMPNKYRNEIEGLLSKDPDEIGQMLHGYRIYSLEEVEDSDGIIIIATSKQFQGIVHNRIKHVEGKGMKIVRLYQ